MNEEEEMFFKQVHPVIDLDVRNLCFCPYGLDEKTKCYSHPKGCPNYGKKKGCPPLTPIIYEILDLSKPVFAIWNVFDFAEHCKRMQAKHLQWSKRQIECCLYWQPKARKQLKNKITKFLSEWPNYTIVGNPEGAGVNLTATMKTICIELEWPPVTRTYQIVLGGVRK